MLTKEKIQLVLHIVSRSAISKREVIVLAIH